jgi:Erv1 / Alr family
LGWATLHSIAVLYPDSPTNDEKQMILRWFIAFRDTILCPSCQAHFSGMFDSYIHRYPYWWNSRRDLSEFVFRAHNTVNARTNAKVYAFSESLEELERVFPAYRSAEIRRAYLLYIRQDWMKNITIEGIASFTKIKELNVIESEYWGRKSFAWGDLSRFEGLINVSPLIEHLSVLNSIPGIPRITEPGRGFSLKLGVGKGKIGGLRSLR